MKRILMVIAILAVLIVTQFAWTGLSFEGVPQVAQASINYNRMAAFDWLQSNHHLGNQRVYPDRYCTNLAAGVIFAGGVQLRFEGRYDNGRSYFVTRWEDFIGNHMLIGALAQANLLQNHQIEVFDGTQVNLQDLLLPGDIIFLNIGYHGLKHGAEGFNFLRGRLGDTTPSLKVRNLTDEIFADHVVVVSHHGQYMDWNPVAGTGHIANLRNRYVSIVGIRFKTGNRTNPYQTVQAEDFSHSQGLLPVVNGNTIGMGYADPGDYLRFDELTFPEGAAKVRIRYSSAGGGNIFFHVGTPDGPVVASANLARTGSFSSYEELTILVSRGLQSPLFIKTQSIDLDWFIFERGSPPLAPSRVQAVPSKTSIRITWHDPSTNESGFHIHRKQQGSIIWSHIGSVGSNVTSYTDTSPHCGVTYEYRVVAYNSAGQSYSVNNAISSALCKNVNRRQMIEWIERNNYRDGNGYNNRQCASYVANAMRQGGIGIAENIIGNDQIFSFLSNGRHHGEVDIHALVRAIQENEFVAEVRLYLNMSVPLRSLDVRPGDVIFYDVRQIGPSRRAGKRWGAEHSVIVTDNIREDGEPLLAQWNKERYAIWNPDPERSEHDTKPYYITHNDRLNHYPAQHLIVRFYGNDLPRKVVPNQPIIRRVVGDAVEIAPNASGDDWEFEVSTSNVVKQTGLEQGSFRTTIISGRHSSDLRIFRVPSGTYYVHVRHVRGDRVSPWTVAQRVVTQAPDMPHLFTPSDRANILDTKRPRFVWTCNISAAKYQISLTSPGRPTLTETLWSPLQCTDGIMSFMPPTDLATGNWTWTVTATNGTGSRSATRQFALPLPTAAAPLAPSGTITSTRQPEFRFSCGSHALTYTVYIETPLSTLRPVSNASQCINGVMTFRLSTLLPDGQHRWWIVSKNVHGEAHSSSLTFTVDVQDLPAPVITAPQNNQTFFSASVLFSAVNALPQLEWQLAHQSDTHFSNPIWTRITGSSFGETLAYGSYKVRARNRQGPMQVSAWSNVVNFSVVGCHETLEDMGVLSVVGETRIVSPTCAKRRYTLIVPNTGRVFVDMQTEGGTNQYIMRLTTDAAGNNVLREVRPASTGRGIFWYAPHWWGGLTPGQTLYYWVIPNAGVTLPELRVALWQNWPVLTDVWSVQTSSDIRYFAAWHTGQRTIVFNRIAGNVEYNVKVYTNNGSTLIADVNSTNGAVSINVNLGNAPTIVHVTPLSGFGSYEARLTALPAQPAVAPTFVPRQ